MKAYDVKRGYAVEHNGQTWIVRSIDKSSPSARGGNTTYRFQLYAIPGGQKLDLSLRAEDELREVDLSRRPATYSYRDADGLVFMDVEDYTQYTLPPDVVGDQADYITEGLEGCYVQIIDDQPIGLQLPQSVVLEVVDTAPELKGASATKRAKPAKLSTGLEILVPEYITAGEKVWVNTDTGEFGGRA
ncbi:MAG TPA: elongation factor P-like protein YeiP [Candidatus Saccharimonadia bacterium]|nr:elongation factor P-like protein YeiP [Candidatus Saccharimonadia bacterium]